MTRRRFTILLAVEMLAFAFLAFALLDRHAHQRDPIYGVNQWGYRDEARGSKEPGEIRVALVGGSGAFEADLPYTQTLAGQMFLELRAAGSGSRQNYSVVNLAEPRASADGYVQTLRAYMYLRSDAVCIFDGYDALKGTPPHARRRSPAFRIAGYLPILPARLLGRPGWLSDRDGGIADILRDGTGDPQDVSCSGASAAHCGAIAATVRFALQQRQPVLVVSPPAVSSRHAQLQRSLTDVLTREFGRNPQFASLDLGSALNHSDHVESTDGIHRTGIGNHVVGQKIAHMLIKWPPFAELQRASSRAGAAR